MTDDLLNEEIKNGLTVCAGNSCDGCSYYKFSNCYDKLKLQARDLITKQERDIEILKTALKWYMDMYGCRPERNVHDSDVEYSCNGYVTDKEEATVLLEARKMLDWWE